MNAHPPTATRILARSILLAVAIGVVLNLPLFFVPLPARLTETVATLGAIIGEPLGLIAEQGTPHRDFVTTVLLINGAVYSAIAFGVSVLRRLRRSRSGAHTA